MRVLCAGLCQAKIAAAELWRAYSEHYRSHQARHPVTGASRPPPLHHQQQQQQLNLCEISDAGRAINASSDAESISPTEPAQSQKSLLVEPDDVGELTTSPPDGNVDDAGGRHDNGDVIQTGCELIREGSVASSNSNDDDVDDDSEVDGVNVSLELGSDVTVWNDQDDDSIDGPRKSPLRARLPADVYNSTNTADDDVNSSTTTMTINNNTLPQNVRFKSEAPAATVSQGFGVASDDQHLSPSAVQQLYNASLKTDDGRFTAFSNSSASAPSAKTAKKSPGERQSSSVDYRRSERGLSFLFPSFSDHGMSLLDKVRITVARHKNNYFLGWTADQLARLDPIVRPKVPVTPAVYREYCHRNAMKYDSNLQFACESPEPWAAEFRTRLTLPPADGGFSSLCEVKLEAGRLWREPSGRYRMHNIVKWQMGMNSAVLANGSAAATAAAAVTSGRTRAKTSPAVKMEHQLTPTYPGLDRHRLSTQAAASFGQSRSLDDASKHAVFMPSVLSVTAPSSLALNSGPFYVSPVCSTPRFAGQLCLTSTAPTAAVHDSPTSVLSDALDMSVSTPSTDAGPLFEPLPADMPAASQLRVWLERHRRGYFVNTPSPSVVVDPAVDYVRPRRWPVTPALLNAEIPPGVVEVLRKIDHLLSLPVDQLPAPAKRFRERLNAPPGSDDVFATFEEAVTEALSACRTAQDAFSANGGVDGDAASRHRKRKRSRPEYAPSSLAMSYSDSASASEVPVSSNGGAAPFDCVSSDDDDDDDGLVVALSPSGTPSPHQPHSPSSASLSVEAVQQLLWSSRSSLHDACVQNPQLSWNERLEPLRPTLTCAIGPDYATPSQSHAAAVDLVLALLHARLDDLARCQSRQHGDDV